MSVRMSNLVWEACLRPEQKYILLALADQANDEGYCVYRKTQEITHAAIAKKTGLSVRTIQRQVAEMLERGFLEITRAESHHSPREYRIRGDKLSSLNRIIRGDTVSPLKAVDKSGQGCQNVTPHEQSGVTSTTGRGDIHDREGCHPRQPGVTRCHPTYKVLDVESRNCTLSHVLTKAEREVIEKDLGKIFPQIVLLPKAVSSERALLFLHKVRTGEIAKNEVKSPVGFMLGMVDEDVSRILSRYREVWARGRSG